MCTHALVVGTEVFRWWRWWLACTIRTAAFVAAAAKPAAIRIVVSTDAGRALR